MKREGVIQTRKVLLRIKIDPIRDDPPTALVGDDVEALIGLAPDVFDLHPLDVLDSLVAGLAVDVVRNIAFREIVAFGAVPT